MAKKEPDRLSRESSAALAAGMSYGKWKAMQDPVKVTPPQGSGPKCVCQFCGKKFTYRDKHTRKYCSEECRFKMEYQRKRERIMASNGALEHGEKEIYSDELEIRSNGQAETV